MKKHIALIAAMLFILALSGCASNETGSAPAAPSAGASEGAATEAPPINPEDSAPAIAPAAEYEETDIAFVTMESPEEISDMPPRLQVMYSGDGLSACAAMTIGTYSWDDGEGIIDSDSIGPVACAVEGAITARVDLDAVSENEPKINLYGGAEITGAKLFPLDGGDFSELSYTADGVISVPSDVYDGVVCVSASFPQGVSDYFFLVERSLTNPKKPPELRVYSGDYLGFIMTKGGYEWTHADGDYAVTDIADVSSPWDMYQNGYVTPKLSALPGEMLTIMLPEGGEITGADIWSSSDNIQPLEYSGNVITLPEQDISAVCSVTVEMPGGRCEYLFAVDIGESASSPAYDPTNSTEIQPRQE